MNITNTIKTDYIVVEGDKNTFVQEMNKLSNRGYVCYGNMNTNIMDKVVVYTLLMSKTTKL